MTNTRGTHCGRFERILNRRHFLERAGAGFGSVALMHLLASQGLLAETGSGAATAPNAGAASAAKTANPLAPRPGDFPARARSIIWLFMEGAPSAVDTFD